MVTILVWVSNARARTAVRGCSCMSVIPDAPLGALECMGKGGERARVEMGPLLVVPCACASSRGDHCETFFGKPKAIS